MESLYFDEIHQGGKDSKSVLLKILIVIAAIVLCYICMCFFFTPFGQFAFLFFFGSIAGAIYLFRRMNKEYEYIFTNGEIDIDIISGKMSRKRACTISSDNIEVFTKYTDEDYKKYSKDVVKVNNYSTGVKKDCYIIVVNINHTKLMIMISPTERLVEALKPYLKKLEFLKKLNNNY